jgi:hypothetical protein
LLLLRQLRPKYFLQGRRHARSRFARPHHGNPPHGVQIDLRSLAVQIAHNQHITIHADRFAHQLFRPHGIQAGLPNAHCIAAEITQSVWHEKRSNR